MCKLKRAYPLLLPLVFEGLLRGFGEEQSPQFFVEPDILVRGARGIRIEEVGGKVDRFRKQFSGFGVPNTDDRQGGRTGGGVGGEEGREGGGRGGREGGDGRQQVVLDLNGCLPAQ